MNQASEQIAKQYVNAGINKNNWGNLLINVKVYGAKGNGVTDDYKAIGDAVAYIKAYGGGTLYFPPGKYRIGRDSARTSLMGAIHIEDISNIKIDFDPDAVLWMDNLNSSGLGDQCHGILVKGNCDNLYFNNVRVEWSTFPTARSTGDALRFEGGIDPDTCPRNIKIIRPTFRNVPQASCIVHGCRDVWITGVLIENTWADGVHLNANHRNVVVDGVMGFNVGDDCVGCVTYYDVANPSNPYVYGNGRPPFNSPDITTRNNNHSVVRNILVDGHQRANGVRISGGYDITVENVKCRNRKTAVIVDSAYGNGTTIRWSYLASQKITIRGVRSYMNNVGFQVQYFNAGAADQTNWRNETNFSVFDITAEDIEADNDDQYGIYFEKCRGVKMRGFNQSNKEVRLRNVMDLDIGHLKVTNGAFFNLIGKDDGWGIPISTTTPEHKIKIGSLYIENGEYFSAYAINGAHIDNLFLTDNTGRALVIKEVVNFDIDNVTIIRPNRSNGSDANSKNAINVIRAINSSIRSLVVQTDSNNFAIDIGGADATFTDVTDGFTIFDGTIISTRNDAVSGVVIQGSTFAAKNVFVGVKFLNKGEASPKWRLFGRPALSVGATSDRPTGGTVAVALGFSQYDTTQGRPVWHKGSDVWGGANEPLTSIAAIPLYVSQLAIVAGVAYMAVGTSSTADWKQIT